MSRRPSAPPVGRINTARARMAPGGRMWSEAPLRYPRRRIAMAGHLPGPVVMPTAAYMADAGNASNDGDTSAGWVTVDTGWTHVAVVAVRAISSTITPPAGWTTLDEFVRATGSSPVLRVGLYVVEDAAADTSGVFTIGNVGGGQVAVEIVKTAFVGLSSGGTFHLVEGAHFTDPNNVYQFKTPDPSWVLGWQLTFQFGNAYGFYSVPPLCENAGGLVSHAKVPYANAVSQAAVEAAYGPEAPHQPESESWYFDSIGAYRPYGSLALALGWTPT